MSKILLPCTLDDIEGMGTRTVYYNVDADGEWLDEIDSTDDDDDGYRCHRCYETFDNWDEVQEHLEPETIRED